MHVEHLFTGDNVAAFLTLTALEIVLGIDNIVFISILAQRLPTAQQPKARSLGLMLAMLARIILLLGIAWIMGLTAAWFTIPFVGELTSGGEQGHTVFDPVISGRDLILIVGGGFLIYKATHEIHDKVEGSQETLSQPKSSRFGSVLVQIIIMDMVFSLDSVITAVGMVDKAEGAPGWVPIAIMVAAIVVAIGVMLAFAGPIARFIQKHPTTKMLALAFLFMIGLVLVADGFGMHVPKGYIYSAMVFSLAVEMLNLRVKANKKPGPGSPEEPVTAETASS